MSDTPRTDAAEHNMGSIVEPHYVVDADFSRQLERELAEAQEELNDKRKFCYDVEKALEGMKGDYVEIIVALRKDAAMKERGMSDKLREAAQAALDAMKLARGDHGTVMLAYSAIESWLYHRVDLRLNDAIKAVEDALAEPAIKESLTVAEPVAWRYQNGITETEYLVWKKGTGGRNWTPLYAEPLPCPTCQSLARAVMMDQTGKA